MRKRQRGALEAEVLAAVARRRLTVHEVGRAVDAELSYTAIHTILTRLVDKGLLTRERTSRGHVYRAAPEAPNVVAGQMDALLRRGPDRSAVLQSFVSGLSDEDAESLRAWLSAREEDDRR
ncbi:BlaI/MecI/CopY family transcriptional regulator [Amycolatopsis alkalitolerans]|uniref:BlaI/MecI/CopY family transcriptional regulator n=1 Tax=Amycolatopsis alkalitolerans TaxID=2547244 RepID=A0A5C4LPZ1_9PSEU|nr:BlaI/MecI/CopY family transcriptional regulator [Amycolatopsis alkalitolerans]TNC20066.1 BlaI/MecI/CopY family transcriptional regulator [Amycolatopsis alkalitolerans]